MYKQNCKIVGELAEFFVSLQSCVSETMVSVWLRSRIRVTLRILKRSYFFFDKLKRSYLVGTVRGAYHSAVSPIRLCCNVTDGEFIRWTSTKPRRRRRLLQDRQTACLLAARPCAVCRRRRSPGSPSSLGNFYFIFAGSLGVPDPLHSLPVPPTLPRQKGKKEEERIRGE